MKTRFIYLLASLLVLSSFGAGQDKCFAQQEQYTDAQGIAGSWQLVPVLPSDTAAGKVAVIQFNTANNSFIGNTGCNAMSGKFSLNGNMLSFKEQEITTKNDCQGYNEEAFMASMLKVNHFKIEGGVLELMVDQTVLSKWVRKEPSGGIKAF